MCLETKHGERWRPALDTGRRKHLLLPAMYGHTLPWSCELALVHVDGERRPQWISVERFPETYGLGTEERPTQSRGHSPRVPGGLRS